MSARMRRGVFGGNARLVLAGYVLVDAITYRQRAGAE